MISFLIRSCIILFGVLLVSFISVVNYQFIFAYIIFFVCTWVSVYENDTAFLWSIFFVFLCSIFFYEIILVYFCIASVSLFLCHLIKRHFSMQEYKFTFSYYGMVLIISVIAASIFALIYQYFHINIIMFMWFLFGSIVLYNIERFIIYWCEHIIKLYSHTSVL